MTKLPPDPSTWVIHEKPDGAWAEMPAGDYAEMRRLALIRGISMSDVLAEAWRAFAAENRGQEDS